VPPAYALGGVIDPAGAWACRQAGGYGVAAVGAVLRADRPEQLLGGLLHALGESG
jgi:thiamine monophosphate synthase